MAQLNFDASQVQPDAGFEPIPAGWYKALMDESDWKPTKAGDGSYLNCRFSILEGPYAGRKIFVMLNLRNPNQQAVDIALKQLSAIAHAVGIMQVADSSQLHNIPMQIKVKIRKDKDGEYDDKNEISSYKHINEQVGATAAAPGAPAAGAPAAGGGWTPPAAGAAPPPAAPPATPPATPPAPPAPPATPPAPPAPPHDPVKAAEADGWVKHPQNPAYHYKGSEVVETTALAQRYPAPAAPTAPPAPWTPPAGGQPWQAQPPAAGAPAAAAPTPPAPPHDAQKATPPWQQPKS